MNIWDIGLKQGRCLRVIVGTSHRMKQSTRMPLNLIPNGTTVFYGRYAYGRFMNEHVKDVLQGHLGWGSGRRLCVGWNVGWKNMFITFSRMLYCFDFVEDPVTPLRPISPWTKPCFWFFGCIEADIRTLPWISPKFLSWTRIRRRLRLLSSPEVRPMRSWSWETVLMLLIRMFRYSSPSYYTPFFLVRWNWCVGYRSRNWKAGPNKSDLKW